MTLAAPAWLGLLALAPLIAWLHLRRRAVVEVPSTWIWRHVDSGTQASPQVRRPPSSIALWLQLAMLVVASLALSEPRFGGASARGPVHVVLDAGAAMAVLDGDEGTARYDVARDSVLDAVRESSVERSWSVWWAGSNVVPLALEHRDPHAVVQLVEDTTASHDRADWDAAARALAPHLSSDTTVAVVTSEPRRARDALESVVLESGADLVVTSVAGPFDNLALDVTRAEVADGNERRWLLDLVVGASGEPPAPDAAPELVVQFQPDGTDTGVEIHREELAFSLGGAARTTIDVTVPGPGLLTARLSRHDVFPTDDTVALRLDAQPARPVVGILAGDRSDTAVEASPTYEALSSLEGYDVRVIADDDPLEDLDLLVIDGVPDPMASTSEHARPLARLWLGTGPGVRDLDALGEIDATVTNWIADHAVTRGTNWGALAADRARLVEMGNGTDRIVEGLGGTLVGALRRGAHRDVIVALDSADPRFSESPQFPTLIADAVAWLAPLPTEVEACTVGLACRVPVLAPGAVTLQHAASGATLEWPDPTGRTFPTRSGPDFRPELAGTWRWTAGAESRLVAVGMSPAGRAAITEAAVAESDAPSSASSGRVAVLEERGDLWSNATPWLALLGSLILAEGLLSGLGKERFWRLRGWATVGRARRRYMVVAALHVVALGLVGLALVRAPFLELSVPHVVVVVQDRDASDRLPIEARDRRVVRSTVSGDVFDAERELRAGLARIEPDASGRIVLASGRPPTRGDTFEVFAALHERSVAVDVLPPAGLPTNDMLVDRLGIDRQPRVGDAAELQAVFVAADEGEARIEISRGDAVETSFETALRAGSALVTAPVRFDEPGLVRFDVTVASDTDPRETNDRGALVVDVGPAPVIHVLSSEEARGARFVEALRLQGLDARLRPPFTAGTEVGDYSDVDGVVLMNVPALELSTLQQRTLEAYVRDAGGGLAILGGERAFGPGGYHETILDRLSPLASMVPRDAPEVAMLFILDRSGSMQQTVGSATRLDVAKQATLSAVELLGDRSRVGIVVFDEQARVLLPFTDTDALAPIEDSLRPLVPGGGTSLYPGLELGVELLEGNDSVTKHVVVLTDGLSQPGDFGGAVRTMRDLGATVSAVAIGAGADVEAVQQLARSGGGLAHVTTDFEALPGILAQEALMLASDPVIEGPVEVLRTQEDPGLMSGVPSSLPPIAVFVETTAKRDADVLLEDGEGRPLMASWRYGSGRVLAFGSHGTGPWVDSWTALQAFPTLWSQWVRWTTQTPARTGLRGRTEAIDDEAWIEVRATDEDGSPDEGLDLVANLHELDRSSPVERDSSETTRLDETAPGRYEGYLPLDPGAWEITVRGSSHDPLNLPIAHAYPAHLAGNDHRLRDLSRLAELTGGRSLLGGEPAFPEGTSRRFSVTPDAWRPWLGLALVAVLFMLLVRYVPRVPRWITLRSRRGRETRRARSASGP